MIFRNKFRWALVIGALFILIGSIGLTGFLLFSNYQNVRLFKQAESNFRQGDDAALSAAEAQLLRLTANDPDNEQAFILLGKIAFQKKVYPEYVYYSLQAHKLNPLSEENEKSYIESLLYAREFQRLENFLASKGELTESQRVLLLYAAGINSKLAKYKDIRPGKKGDLIAEITELLYKQKKLTTEEKIFALKKFLTQAKNDFQKQEIFAALFRQHIKIKDLDNAEKFLTESYKLNEFAFAPVLGRFYSTYRTIGKAMTVYEKHLAFYRDPDTALQYAELCCLLKKPEKITELAKIYQRDTGKAAMMLCYYFDVLTLFASGDIKGLRQQLSVLQDAVDTPLAKYIHLSFEIENGELAKVSKYYGELTARRSYPGLQDKADMLVRNLVAGRIKTPEAENPLLTALAEKVYWRSPDALIGKFLILSQRRNGGTKPLLLVDVMKRFSSDRGVRKIAIEYYLEREIATAEKLIASYRKDFPANKGDMFRYEVVLAARRRDYNEVSKLFQANCNSEIAQDYWQFAISTRRVADLKFLASAEPLYKPFCEAAILDISGNTASALDKLVRADGGKNHNLTFYAAKMLAENNKIDEALRKYAGIPENSPYQLDVLLNSSELFAARGNQAKSLELAKRAYELAPQLPETQFCYADKLEKNGRLTDIPDVIRQIGNNPYRKRLTRLKLAGLLCRLKGADYARTPELGIGLCKQILLLSPGDKTALEYDKKFRQLQKATEERKI